MGIWRLKCDRRNTNQRMCPMCSKEEGWSHILKCEGTRSWREELVEERFTSIALETGVGKIVASKKELAEIGLYLSKRKEK
jgi:hypothetical protein